MDLLKNNSKIFILNTCALDLAGLLLIHGDAQGKAKNEQVIKMITYTVLLQDGTVGTISDDTLDGQSAEDFLGEVMNVHLHYENGNPVEVQGELVKVLEASEY